MKKSEIQVGGQYTARISGKIVPVRVDAIRETVENRGGKLVDSHRYDVTNLVTGRKVTFRSAMKFRGKAPRYWLGVQDGSGDIRVHEWQTRDDAESAKERAKSDSSNVRVALAYGDSQAEAYAKFVKAWKPEQVA